MGADRLSDLELEKIRYQIVHNEVGLPVEGQRFYEKLRAYWEKSWTETFKILKSNEVLNPEDFSMQSRITALVSGDEIVGMHLLKDYSVEDFKTHRYFANYNENFLSALNRFNVKRLQSLQYFWVDPNWSKKKTGINFAAIIGALTIKNQIDRRLDASITLARKDNASHDIACSFGLEEIDVSMMHNVPVSQMICLKPKSFPDILVSKYSDFYWKNKIEFKAQVSIKKAA